MASFVQVRPSAAEEVFRCAADGDGVRVEVGPVCFQIKEKPQANKAELFVAVNGWFRLSTEGGALRSGGYHTQVGYFRLSEGKLEHVYGIHHDFDPELIAHPVYHAQMAPMIELADPIRDHFNLNVDLAGDYVTPILANVRLPTARMDVFAVFMQLCSDHLINSESQKAQVRAYKAAITTCGFFEGACGTIPRLGAAFANQSLRPQHWYVR